jgi:hypothetical protein
MLFTGLISDWLDYLRAPRSTGDVERVDSIYDNFVIYAEIAVAKPWLVAEGRCDRRCGMAKIK